MPREGTTEGFTAVVGFEYCNRLFAIENALTEDKNITDAKGAPGNIPALLSRCERHARVN